MNPYALGIDIAPGGRFSYSDKYGTVYTDMIAGVKYQSGGVVYPTLTRLQRFVRKINPWRKPLKPTYSQPTVTFTTDPCWEIARTIKTVDELNNVIHRFFG